MAAHALTRPQLLAQIRACQIEQRCGTISPKDHVTIIYLTSVAYQDRQTSIAGASPVSGTSMVDQS